MKRKNTEFADKFTDKLNQENQENKKNKLDISNKRKNIIEHNIEHNITKKIKINLEVDLEENTDIYLDMDFNNINIIDNDYINSYIK